MFLWKKKRQWWHRGGGHGAFGPPPVGAPAPTYPLTRTNMAKISHFWLFIFFPSPPPHNPLPHPPPHPHPHPNKKKSGAATGNLVLRLVKIFSGVKINAIWRLVFKAKIFTWVKYKLLDKNTNWTSALSGKTHMDHFVLCCCLLLMSVVCHEKGLTITFSSIFHMLWWISTKVGS